MSIFYNDERNARANKARQTYQMYKNGVKNTYIDDEEEESRKLEQQLSAMRAQNYEKQMQQNMQSAKPASVKQAEIDYANVNDQAKGLLYAYTQKYKSGQEKTNSDAANMAKLISSKSGLYGDDLNKQIQNMEAINDYSAKTKYEGYKTLNDTEKLDYARNKLAGLSEDEQSFLKQYAQYYSDINKAALDPIKVTGGDTVIDRLKNAFKKEGNLESTMDYFQSSARAQKAFGWSSDQTKQYFDLAKRIQNDEDQKALNESAAINQSDNKVLRGVQNTVASALNPQAQLSTLGAMANFKTNSLGYDANSPWNRALNYKNELQSQVANNAIGGDTTGKKVGQFLYNTGMSTIDSAEQILLTGGLGKFASLVPFFSGALTQSYSDAKSRGLNDDKAALYGLAGGIAEAGMELVPLDHFWKIVKGAGFSGGKEAAKAWGKQIIEEALEEGGTDILNMISDKLIAGDENKTSFDYAVQDYINNGDTEEEARKKATNDAKKEIALDMLGGGISGGVMGGVGIGINTARSKSRNAEISNAFNKESQSIEVDTDYDRSMKEQSDKYANNPTRYLADTINDSTEEGKQIKDRILEIANKEASGKKLTVNDHYALNEALTEAQEKKLDRNSIKDNSYVPKEYRSATTNVVENEARPRLVEAINKGDVESIARVYSDMKNSVSADMRQNADNVMDQFKGKALNSGISEEQWEGIKTSAQDAYMEGLRGTNRGQVGVLSQSAQEAYNAGREAKIQMDTDLANSLANTKSTEGAQNAYKANRDSNISVMQYDKLFDSAYNAGAIGLSYNEMDESVKTVLGEEKAKAIYEAGANDLRVETDKAASSLVTNALKVNNKGTGTFSDLRTKKNSNIDTEFMRAIAKVTGLDIKLTSARNDKVQASFTPGDSTIEVTEDHAAQLIHELGEFASFYASEEYESVRKAAMGAAKEILGTDRFNNVLNNYQNTYKKINANQTVFDSSSEMANDYLVSLMSTEKGQSALADYLAKNYDANEAKTLGDKIKDMFAKIVDSIKSLIGSSKLNSAQREYLNKEVAANEKNIELFIKALDKAIENYKNFEVKKAETNNNVSEAEYSITTVTEAIGLNLEMENGMAKFVDDYGNEITNFTPSMIENSQLGAILKYANEEVANRRSRISDSDLKKEYKMLADLFNQMREMQDIDLVWAVNSAVGYQQVKDGSYASKVKSKFAAFTSNADPQYASTIDFTTICLKTQAIVDAMSGTMKKLGRGLTKEEIVDVVYKNTHKAGEPVPCPVCYVFSRWVGLGGLLDRINNLQEKYPKSMSNEEVQKILDGLESEKNKIKKKLGEDAKAEKILRAEYDVLAARDFASKSDKKLKLNEKDQKRFDVLSQYVDVMDQEAWFKNVRLNPKYKPVPQDVLFDINAGRRFAEDYPLTWKFRTTRGSGMGKATIPYSDLQLGQVIRGISSPTAVNKGTLGNLESDPFLFDKQKNKVRGGELSTSAKTILNNAIKNQKAQNLYNGQRVQSTSDFRYEYGLDYLMAYLELQAVGAKVQMYTKVPEAVIMNASVNAEVNCSIMPLGYGYVADKEGNPILDKDGNIQLQFSSVTGMHPDDAFNLSSMFDNVQPIMVGIGNTHIRACLADERITFVIPYHASGSTEARYVSMMKTIEENVVNRQDYSDYQNDIEMEDATKEQLAAREIRKNILTGKYWTKGQKGLVELTKAEKKILENNKYLKDLYNRFYVEGVDADCYKVVVKSKPAAMIMPYEYWDTSLTIKDADQNTERFKEYCNSLGIIPRFSGYKKGGKYNAEFDFTKDAGYWKMLPDRRMYNRDGTYHVQKAINVSDFRLDYLSKTESEKGIVMPSKVNDKSKVKSIVEQSVADINSSKFSLDLDYMNAVESGDMETAQRMVDEAASREGFNVKAYHGTTAGKFTIFRTNEIDNNMGSHFGSKEIAESFADGTYGGQKDLGSRIYSVYLKAQNPYVTYDWFAQDDFYPAIEAMILADEIGTPEALAIRDEIMSLDPELASIYEDNDLLEEGYLNKVKSEILYGDFRKLLDLGGYDSIQYENGLEIIGDKDYIIQHPEQIKLADPVTYDDKGNVIPLSQRFDSSSPDIRYSLEVKEENGMRVGFTTDSYGHEVKVYDYKSVDPSLSTDELWGKEKDHARIFTIPGAYPSAIIDGNKKYEARPESTGKVFASAAKDNMPVWIRQAKTNNFKELDTKYAPSYSNDNNGKILGRAILSNAFKITQDLLDSVSDKEKATWGTTRIGDYVFEFSDVERLENPVEFKTYGQSMIQYSDAINQTHPDSRYSLDVDSDGNTLSEGQQKFFADSKVRDENGALLVMYHGSKSRDKFTVFDKNHGIVNGRMLGDGFYFTPNKSSAAIWGKNADEKAQMFKVYLNIKNPFYISENIPVTDDMLDFARSIDPLRDSFDMSEDMKQRVLKNTEDLINGLKSTADFFTFYGKEYVRARDYDGIILKAEENKGFNRMYGDQYVVFDENQIKKTTNKKPTEDPDIRYSLDLDEYEFELFESSNPTVSNVSILEEGLKALKGKDVDTKTINSIAAKLKNEFASTIDKNEFADMLNRAFAYLHTQDNIKFNDVMAIFNEVAKPVIDQATKVDNADLYNEFIDNFRGRKIKLSEKQLSEIRNTYGSYDAFKKAMYPLQFSIQGETTLEDMWSTLAEAYPGLIEYGVADTDMPYVLDDVLQSLKPSPTNTFGADAQEVGKDLALRIVEEYLGAQSDAKLKRASEQMKEAGKKYRAEVRDRYQKKLADAKEKMREESNQRRDDARQNISEAKQKYADQVAQIKAKSKDKMSNYKDRQNAKEQKRQIAKITRDLIKRITEPTEQKHVPSSLVEPLTQFLQCLDFVEPEVRYDNGNYYMIDYTNKIPGGYGKIVGKTPTDVLTQFYDKLNAGEGTNNQLLWQNRLNALRKIFAKSANMAEDMEDILNLLDVTMADALEEVLENNKYTLDINHMSTNDLITIKNALRSISHAINQQNKAFTSKQSISDTAHGIQDNAANLKRKDHTKLYNTLHDTLIMNMMNPETYFTLLGKEGRGIYTSLQRALEKKIGYVHETENFMDKILKGIDKRELRKWRNEVITFATSEGDLKMSIAHVMSLYELSKRQQAMLHMPGGIEVEKITEGLRKVEINQNKGIHLSESEMQSIFDTLTDKQKEVADAMQKYMAEVCGAWGNEASMTMYDYEKFLDPDYFPITVDSDTNKTQDTTGMVNLLNGIERMGFTKAVNKYSKNPLVVRDIFSVFTEHAANMATYASYAPAIKDALRVYNFKDVQINGDNRDYIPVKKALDESMGRTDKSGQMYFEKLIRDINGTERANSIKNFGEKFVGAYKAAAVGGNIRVVVQQPTAYVRAATIIKPQYLIEAMPKAFIHDMDKLKNENELIYWKSQGYYESSLGKGIESIILGTDSVRERVTEASMWLAGKADDMTWACLYDATERQIKAENPGISEEEFRSKVNDLFADVIHETQVVDSTLMKSPWQRSKDGKDNLMNSFMSEPIKSYNIMMKALIQADRGEIAKRTAIYAGGVLIATDMLNAMAQAIVDAMRYRDDDEEYLDQVLEYWYSNFKDNVNPIKRIPFLKDVWDQLVKVANGESTYGQTTGQLYEYAALNSITQALGTLKKQLDGSYGKTNYAAYMDYAKAMSQILGVPVYNFSRDAVAAWNMVVDEDKELVKEVEKPSDKYKKIISVLDMEKNDDDLNKAVQKALEKEGTVRGIESNIKSAFRQNYLDAIENQDAELEEEIFNKAVRGYMALGMNRVEAEQEVESWTDVTVGYSDLDKAIETGDGIQLATKVLMDAKDTDKILEHIYNYYGATIELNRARGYESDVEDNVNEALRYIDGSNYNTLARNQEAKAKEAAEKKAKAEANKAYKENVYSTIDTGTDYRSAVNDAYNGGLELDALKSAITSEYKEKFIAAYKAGDYNTATVYRQRIAAVKAYCDQLSGLKIPNKYGGDYYTYELVQIDKWLNE